MRYTVYAAPSGQRVLYKLPPDVRTHLLNPIRQLAHDPRQGKRLKGTFRFLRLLPVVYRGTHYRIIYEIMEHAQEIHIHLAASRENLYQQLFRLRLKPRQEKRAA